MCQNALMAKAVHKMFIKGYKSLTVSGSSLAGMSFSDSPLQLVSSHLGSSGRRAMYST